MTDELWRQFRRNVEKGPSFVERATSAAGPSPSPVRTIAFYLPQFHAIPENDEWWGEGFTEWTNVTKALPSFDGHYQPRLPADLGFYDLKNPEVLRKQAEIARQFGIEGFCFHFYWFGGKRLLETPLENLLSDRSIDLPFCINGANENWTRRWEGRDQEILLGQQHSAEDDLAFADAAVRLFEDPRYIRAGDRPLLLLYRPAELPDARATVERWRSHFAQRDVNPLILMTQVFGDLDPAKYGFDGAVAFPPVSAALDFPPTRPGKLFDHAFAGSLRSYSAVARLTLESHSSAYRSFPGVCPDWDNSARRGPAAFMLHGSTPEKFGTWVEAAARQAIQAHRPEERFVFVNAWNEWAEGTYLEPDRHYGFAYLTALAAALQRVADDPDGEADLTALGDKGQAPARPGLIERALRKAARALERTARRFS